MSARPRKVLGAGVPAEGVRLVSSIVLQMEERIAASTAGALAHARPEAGTFYMPTVQLPSYGRGDVCALADVNALHTSPATKAWAVRPLIPDGGGGG